MSKRKARFLDDGRDELDMEDAADQLPDPKSKHSLDSDEEDESSKRKYEIIGDEDLDGQEDATIDFDGEIKITPFNMKEEMEEGHFDTEGNYYLNEKDAIKDNWMDNIDWVKIKSQEVKKSNMADESEDADVKLTEADKIELYKQMIDLMKDGENVLKAIKRFGGSGSGSSASSRWIKKKKKPSDSKSEENTANKEKMENLTAIADQLLQAGEFEIYQHTFEKLNFLVQSHADKMEASKPKIPEGIADDDALDIFADNLDSKAKKDESKTDESIKKSEDKVEDEAKTDDSFKKSEDEVEESDEVMWEFKWEDDDGAEIHGPHTSSEMHQWVEDGYFPGGVHVRKISQGPNAPFYSSKRIDFELYI